MKLKTFCRRMRAFNCKRMFRLIRAISRESHIPGLFIFIDMLWCAARYGVGYLDYKVFGFAFVRGAARKTFMTMDDNLSLVRAVNDKAYTYLLDQKCAFNERFHGFLGREWLDLRKADPETFETFLQGKETFFAKEVDSFGGRGVRRIRLEEYPDREALYHQLRANGQYLVEETILQHPEMERLHPGSINTVRIVTLLVHDKPDVMYALIRVGGKGQCVDNICCGGLYAPVDESGAVFHDAFCETEERFYDCHMESGVKFIGFQVPYFHEAVELVKKAAKVVPQVGYVGWDVAIGETGPLLIEGNVIPGYDMCQNYCHLKKKGEGILPRFEKKMGMAFFHH